jgi:hypothetical protein
MAYEVVRLTACRMKFFVAEGENAAKRRLQQISNLLVIPLPNHVLVDV